MRAATHSSLFDSALLTGLVFVALATAAPLTAQQARAGDLVAAVSASSSTNDIPTFFADVLPILQENCQSCHQSAGLNMGGMVAPWPLVTYEDARPRARRIASAVRAGRMPPWSAAEWHKGTFKNERVLEDEEKATIITWAEGGTPAGDPADAPPPPEFLTASLPAGANGRSESPT